MVERNTTTARESSLGRPAGSAWRADRIKLHLSLVAISSLVVGGIYPMAPSSFDSLHRRSKVPNH